MNGLLGAITISSAPASASSTPGAGVAVASPSKRTRSTSSRCWRATNHSWNGNEPAGVSTQVRRASSVAGSSVTSTPSACASLPVTADSGSPLRSACVRTRCTPEIAVTELEPRLPAEPGHDLHRLPGLVRPPPAALLVRHAGERVEDAVEVRRDVEAEHLDVVADVADHRHRRRLHDLDETAQEARSADASREHDDCGHALADTIWTMAEQEHLENAAIAERLESLATLLELAGANPFAARAYRRAASLVRDTKAPVAELVRQGRVRELRGIGPSIEARLRELVETGVIAEIELLEREVPPDLIGLGRFLGLSSQRTLQIANALDVHTADELRAAAHAGRLREVPGVGPKTEAKLLERLSLPETPTTSAPAPAQPCAGDRHAYRDGAGRRGCRRRAPLAGRAAAPGGRHPVGGAGDRARGVCRSARDRGRGGAARAAEHRRHRGRSRRRGDRGRAGPVRHGAAARDRRRGVRRGARAAARSSVARRTSTRRSASPSAPRSCASSRSEVTRPSWSSSARFAATSTATRRGRTAEGRWTRWRRRPAPSVTSTWRFATTRPPSARCRA